jgi:hypothetical protein
MAKVTALPDKVAVVARDRDFGPLRLAIPISEITHQASSFLLVVAVLLVLPAIFIPQGMTAAVGWRVAVAAAFGALAIGTIVLSRWLATRPKPTLYCFDNGLIAPDGTAHHWSTVTVEERPDTVRVGQSQAQHPVVRFTVRADGRVLVEAMTTPPATDVAHLHRLKGGL